MATSNVLLTASKAITTKAWYPSEIIHYCYWLCLHFPLLRLPPYTNCTRAQSMCIRDGLKWKTVQKPCLLMYTAAQATLTNHVLKKKKYFVFCQCLKKKSTNWPTKMQRIILLSFKNFNTQGHWITGWDVSLQNQRSPRVLETYYYLSYS